MCHQAPLHRGIRHWPGPSSSTGARVALHPSAVAIMHGLVPTVFGRSRTLLRAFQRYARRVWAGAVGGDGRWPLHRKLSPVPSQGSPNSGGCKLESCISPSTTIHHCPLPGMIRACSRSIQMQDQEHLSTFLLTGLFSALKPRSVSRNPVTF